MPRHAPVRPRRIDFHTHVVPRETASFDAPVPGWPRLVLEDGCRGHLARDGVAVRALDDRSWDAARRIADMDAAGIDLQVLSPLPATYAYDFEPGLAARFAALQNDAIAALVRARPDRFAGLGTVPLQDVQRACAELERVRAELRLAGVQIGTHAAGRDLTDPALLPFWERCDALGAVVFVHPENAPGFERLREPRLAFAVGYPNETGATAAALLMAGFATRFPALRLAFAHGGGTLPWNLPRLDAVWSAFPDVRAAFAPRPSHAARAFWYDTLTFDADNLRLLARRAGADRLLVGSDYPHALMDDPPGSLVAGCDGLSEAERDAVRGGNAELLLGAEWPPNAMLLEGRA